MKKTLILGSASPRRKEILGYFSLPFDVVVSEFAEDTVPFYGDPADYACRVARGKAEALFLNHSDCIIFTADTVVYCDNKIYGKPRDEKEAFAMLSALVGKWHSVFTGLAVRSGEQEYWCHEETRVLFNTFSDDHIRRYHRQLSYLDKAGAYAIQGEGSLAVKKIDGCFYNVAGLPINATAHILAKVGIDLWDHIAS